MLNDPQLWLTLAIAVVLTIASSALQHSFQTGSPGQKLFRAVTYSLIGLAALFALWLAIQQIGPPQTQEQTTSAKSSVEKANREPLQELVSRLSRHRWALDDESCDGDAIRFRPEGIELVAYFPNGVEIRHQITAASGEVLSARRNGRPVLFQVGNDGFTYVDKGVERWYRLCG